MSKEEGDFLIATCKYGCASLSKSHERKPRTFNASFCIIIVCPRYPLGRGLDLNVFEYSDNNVATIGK